jgi:uncharacterized protein (DUF1330 family)
MSNASIEPTPAQFERLATSADHGPFVMLNLLRFKPRADGIDEADGITGAEAYARYAAAAAEHLQRVGGRILLALAGRDSVIGPADGEWDVVVAVEYPSRQAFLEMTSNPDYLAIHAHRAAALADSRLVACERLQL